jgi:hypothetical protein
MGICLRGSLARFAVFERFEGFHSLGDKGLGDNFLI